MHPSPTSIVEIGEVVGDKFRVDRMLGMGGTSVVVQATHRQLGERVALKFLSGGDPEVAINEARNCLRLKTTHVARVMDVGRHKSVPFIVMEYLEGKNLQAILEENGKLEDPAEAVELVTQVCEAVAEAHRVGLIHRDIKLANLFLVASRNAVPELKLLDFGIATGTDVASDKRTVGTLHYMAPESIQGISDNPRSDLWSIGVVLFELLTGWKPFDSTDAVSLIAEIYEEAHLSLRNYREDLPLELEQVIDRCLEKDPAKRFQDAGELARALMPFAPPRAHVTIDRAVEAAQGAPSSQKLPPTSSARSLRISDPSLRGGSLRSSHARRLRGSGSQSSRSVPTLTSTAPNLLQKKSVVPWALAVVAVAALALVFTFRSKLGGGSSGPSVATTPPVNAVTAAPTPTSETPAAAPTSTPTPTPTPPTPDPTPANTAHVGAGVPAAQPPRPFVRPGAVPAAATPKPAAGTPVAAPSATQQGVERDPWKASKPKLDDNPFR